MELLRGSVLFPLMLFLSCSFWVGRTIDCGGNKIVQTIVVDRRKSNFKTIQAAIDSIKINNNRWVKVHINAGIYGEKVRIPQNKPCIFLEGDGKEITIITSSAAYNPASRIGLETIGFLSYPSNLLVIGISFRNTFNLDQTILRAPAAAIIGDKSAFYNSSFLSFQDTLYDASGRHYFKNCYIQGEVDFIYGSGQSYYEGCSINATQEKSPTGFITAQSRASENEPNGFVFRSCTISGSGQVNLGRAWGPYSRVIFQESYLSSVVTPQGWSAWHFVGQESKFTYAEVKCRGPGADTRKRVKWEKKLNPFQLQQFSLSSFINKDGWLSNLPVRI